MTLNEYLSHHFITLDKLSQRCNVPSTKISQLIQQRLVMGPAYVVSQSSILTSHVFGSMPCETTTDGAYFHPVSERWVLHAIDVTRSMDESHAYKALKNIFRENYRIALENLNGTLWRLTDCFADNGAIISTAMETRLEEGWDHYLYGSFGLCVANPESEAAIVRKEIVQEKLTALSENGSKASFTNAEAQQLLPLIDEYAVVSMPFSPVDYPISSRKRLVDDLRPRVLAVMNTKAR